jgi:hypothetical protein
MANTQAAHLRGAFGVPTFFVNDGVFFGKYRLGQVESHHRRGTPPVKRPSARAAFRLQGNCTRYTLRPCV